MKPEGQAKLAAGVLGVAGGVLAIATALLPPPAQGDERIVFLCGGISAIAGLALFLSRRPASTPVLMAFGLLGTALITIATHTGGPAGGTGDNGLLYLWICLYAFYFFPLRLALAQLVVIAAAYGWLLFDQVPTDEALTRWLVTVTTLLVTGLLFARVQRSVSSMVDTLTDDASHDSLTGLLNRRALEERLAHQHGSSLEPGMPLSVLVIDVDGFKQLNDTLGHPAGDGVLRQVASALKHWTRTLDVVARVGGDEFMVVLPGASRAEAATVAEDLRAAMERAPERGGRAVTVSVGVADGKAPIGHFDELWGAADAAMYEAKRMGGNRVRAVGDGPEGEDVGIAGGRQRRPAAVGTG